MKVGSKTASSKDWTAYILRWKLPAQRDEELYKDGFTDSTDAAGDYPPASWKRPGRGEGLADDVPILRLFRSVDPNDLHQGRLGDCWLVSAMAALAEFPATLRYMFVQ